MKMRPIHGAVVAVAIGGAAAFGASAIKDTTHLGAAAQASTGKKKSDAALAWRARKLDAQAKALRKARHYHPPKLPSVPAAPGPVPSYSYGVAAQPVAAPPAPAAPTSRQVTLTRLVHRHPAHVRTRVAPRKPGEDTRTTTTTTEETPTTPTTTVSTTTQAPVTHTTTSTTSSSDSEHADDSGQTQERSDDGSQSGADS